MRKRRKKQGAKFPAIEGAKKIGKKSKKEVARKLADGKAFIAQLSTSPINAEPQVLARKSAAFGVWWERGLAVARGRGLAKAGAAPVARKPAGNHPTPAAVLHA